MNRFSLLLILSTFALSAFAFDVPLLNGVTVDGAGDDWGARGFIVQKLAQHDGTAAKIVPAPDCSGTLRLGWDDGGLLMLLSLPTARAEAAPTINLIVRDGAHPLNWWQAMLNLPSLKPNEAVLAPSVRFIDHRCDQWVDPRTARDAIAALPTLAMDAKWGRGDAGNLLEARLPWRNLGMTPKEGDTLRVQLQVWGGGPSLSWFPYGWGEKTASYTHLVRLAHDSSPPQTTPDAGETPTRSDNVWNQEGFSLYIPKGVARVRGVYMTFPGTKHRTLVDDARLDGYSPMVAIAGQRAFVEDVGFALLGAGGPNSDAKRVLDALVALAASTNHPELATVPLIADGYSAGSLRTLNLLQLCPERLLAFTSMNYMNGDYLPSDAARKVPGLLYTGPKDQYGKGYPAAFAANRAKSALWALIVQPETGHTVGDCPALLYPFYKDIIAARLVTDADGRTTLRDIDPKAGWLGDAKTFTAVPTADFVGNSSSASWLSSPYLASLWHVLNTQPSGRLGTAEILAAIDAR